MALTVEDGSIVAGANSYVDLTFASEYFAARGTTWPAASPANADAEAALVRATAYIEAKYGASFSGSRVAGREQPLLWPRTGAEDRDGEPIPEDEIPVELKNAVCEAALREYTTPGSLQPDLERGGAIQRVKAGSVEVEYRGDASANTVFAAIDRAIAPLIAASSSSPLFGKVSRA